MLFGYESNLIKQMPQPESRLDYCDAFLSDWAKGSFIHFRKIRSGNGNKRVDHGSAAPGGRGMN